MKSKARYIIAVLIAVIGIAATPFLAQLAYFERGYRAIGGEFLFMPLCLLIACALFDERKVK